MGQCIRGVIKGAWPWLGVVCIAAVAGCEQGDPGPAGPPGVGVPGEEGDPGEPGENNQPSLSGIRPSTVYLEHEVDVTISGFATDFKDGIALDFGPGITASPALVASPNALITRLTIARDAALGPRDVTVGDLIYKGAFSVEPPISVYPYHEDVTPAAGAWVNFGVVQDDISAPFYGQVSLSLSSAGESVGESRLEAYSSYTLYWTSFLDVTAPTSVDVEVTAQNLFGAPNHNFQPAGLTLGARAPIALSADVTGTLQAPHFSALFQVDSTDAEWISVRSTSADPDQPTAMVVLPASGAFADRVRRLPPAAHLLEGSLFRNLKVLTSTSDTHFVSLQGVPEVFGGVPQGTDIDFDVAFTRGPAGAPMASLLEPYTPDPWYVEAAAGDSLSISILDGPTHLCGVDFAATVVVIKSETGEPLVVADTLCPGTLEPCGPGVCPAPPLTIPIEDAGGYMITVEPSFAYCGGDCGGPKDYSALIEVVSP